MTDRREPTEFERVSREVRSRGPVREFWLYLTHSGRWWLAPVIAALMLLAGAILLGGTSAAPLIYALF